MSKKTKRYLMLLVAVGLIAVAAGGSGTFATFNAEVTNTGNTFASGTLFLHDTPNGGTVCKSEDDLTNNTNSSCTWLFNADLSGGSQTATLALNNPGTIAGAGLTFKVAGCTVGDNSAVTGTAVVFGSAPTCRSRRRTRPSPCREPMSFARMGRARRRRIVIHLTTPGRSQLRRV
jgi:predicted ribosomally synthesized peptide with SipW-like signal peptide